VVYLDYGKYKNARNASWQCLLDYNVDSLPVIVSDIIRKSDNIKLLKNSKHNILADGESGRTIKINDSFCVVYRDTEISRRCRFTIAHELGHIFLGHLLINGYEYKTFAERSDSESEANIFARDLLAPACVLHELGATTAEQIAKLCNISAEAAGYRAERIKELEIRNAWYLHPLERQVRKQFDDFIKTNSRRKLS
jgi:Zn-dependent peptidase ImmA (M78 family)